MFNEPQRLKLVEILSRGPLEMVTVARGISFSANREQEIVAELTPAQRDKWEELKTAYADNALKITVPTSKR